jgi:hypothetical protein
VFPYKKNVDEGVDEGVGAGEGDEAGMGGEK